MTGGGTLGPVTPLLAIVRVWQKRDSNIQVSWIGTPGGAERALVESMHIPFETIYAPKFDRDRPWLWPFIPFFLIVSCIQAFAYLKMSRPDIVFTAGGYVSVPVVWIAWLLRIPSWVHQLDVKPGLANKIMAPFAKKISVTWSDSAESFSSKKTSVVGGVVRPVVLDGDKERARDLYQLDASKPTLLVIGGGTGAQSINDALAVIGPELIGKMNVIHLTGKDKMTDELQNIAENYVALEFLGEGIADVFALSDFVVSRAGMGTLIELVALKKPCIIIPLHNFDQLHNAKMLEDQSAAEVLWSINPQILKQSILNLSEDDILQKQLSRRLSLLFPTYGAEEIVTKASEMIK